jgi:hypothetical protein
LKDQLRWPTGEEAKQSGISQVDSEEGKKRGREKEQGRELEMCKAGRVKERGERGRRGDNRERLRGCLSPS